MIYFAFNNMSLYLIKDTTVVRYVKCDPHIMSGDRVSVILKKSEESYAGVIIFLMYRSTRSEKFNRGKYLKRARSWYNYFAEKGG